MVYSNVPCPQCREEDCHFGRAYCANNLIHEQGATGRLVLDQQLREEIALELSPQQWWNFMKHVDDHCSAVSELKECSAAAMQDVGMDAAEVESRLRESFGKDGDNALLKRSREILANAGVTRLPAVTINGAKVKGSLKVECVLLRRSLSLTMCATRCCVLRVPARDTCHRRWRWCVR